MEKTIRVVLVNKTILTDGRKGPDFTPFKAEVSELIKEIEVTKPTPVFKHANNLTRVISVEELKAIVGEKKEIIPEAEKTDEIIVPENKDTKTDAIDVLEEKDVDGDVNPEDAEKTTFEDLGKIDAPDAGDANMNELPPANNVTPDNGDTVTPSTSNQFKKEKRR